MTYTDKPFWDKYYVGSLPRQVDEVLFDDLFRLYLPRDPNKTVLEVGCAGGEFMAHLTKKHGFRPYGIDFSDEIEKTRSTFRFNDLPEPTLFKEDFFAWQPPQRFDVVCSFGFVEHFDDLDAVVKKHAALVAPDGMLFITMPNFAHLQYPLHWLLDRENLRRHNTRIMNLRSLRRALVGLPFQIRHLSYYRTMDFWTENANPLFWQKILKSQVRALSRTINRIVGPNRPNALLSPHIVLVAQRHAEPHTTPPHDRA